MCAPLTFRDGSPVLATVDLAALARVVLERGPGVTVVHALENGHRIGLGVAKLQTDVGQFVLLAQPQRDGHILA